MITDTIGDMLTRIRNANLAYKTDVLIANTKLNKKICEILKKKGFIIKFSTYANNTKNLIIYLKYRNIESSPNSFKGKPCITNLKRLSKPGLRLYSNYKKIPMVFGGLGIIILSTSKGLMTDHEARSFHLGGELICSVW